MSGLELFNELFQMMEETPLSKVVVNTRFNTANKVSEQQPDIAKIVMEATTDFEYRVICDVAAQLHNEIVGEEVYLVPYTSKQTLYYNIHL